MRGDGELCDERHDGDDKVKPLCHFKLSKFKVIWIQDCGERLFINIHISHVHSSDLHLNGLKKRTQQLRDYCQPHSQQRYAHNLWFVFRSFKSIGAHFNIDNFGMSQLIRRDFCSFWQNR